MTDVVCCFCYGEIARDLAVEMALYPPGARDEVQGLYCHGRCLEAAVSRSVPLHPNITDGPDPDDQESAG